MARQKNDGRGRLGGRAKGTPNRAVTFPVWIDGFLSRNRQEFESHYHELSTDSRMKIYAALSVARAFCPESSLPRQAFSIARVKDITQRFFAELNDGSPADGESSPSAQTEDEEERIELEGAYRLGVTDAETVRHSKGVWTDEERASQAARDEALNRFLDARRKGYNDTLKKYGLMDSDGNLTDRWYGIEN